MCYHPADQGTSDGLVLQPDGMGSVILRQRCGYWLLIMPFNKLTQSYLLCESIRNGCKVHGISSRWMYTKQVHLSVFRLEKGNDVISGSSGHFFYRMDRLFGRLISLCRVFWRWVIPVRHFINVDILLVSARRCRVITKPSGDVLYQPSRSCIRLGKIEYLLINSDWSVAEYICFDMIILSSQSR